jgi:putative ABC transport system permease protein
VSPRFRSRLRWSDGLREALTTVGNRPLRSCLTAVGTVLGVGAFVATAGVAESGASRVSERFDAVAATEVRVRDGEADGSNPFPDDVDRRLEALNGVNHAGLMFGLGGVALEPRNASIDRESATTSAIPVVAATPGAVLASLPVVLTGRLYDHFHEGRAERVALLGRDAAEQLGIATLHVRPAVVLGGLSFSVIGIMGSVGRNSELLGAIVIPAATGATEFDPPDANYEVVIDTAPGAAALAGHQAPLALRPDLADRLTVSVPPDPRPLRDAVESDVGELARALSAVALLIGTLAIANTTLVNTIERRSEIGLRRALGATRGHIARQVAIESTVVGTLAAMAGDALAIYTVVIVAGLKGWTATLDPLLTVGAPLCGLLTGALASVPAAIRAARTPPAVTLRS